MVFLLWPNSYLVTSIPFRRGSLVKKSQYIPLLELVIKYKPEDVKDFLLKEPDLVKKLNAAKDQLSDPLKKLVQFLLSVDGIYQTLKKDIEDNRVECVKAILEPIYCNYIQRDLLETVSKKTDKNGDSLLDLAKSIENNEEIIELLLKAEASKQNENGSIMPNCSLSNDEAISVTAKTSSAENVDIVLPKVNDKEFKQQNKICRNLTVISMVLCIAAVLALVATCYVGNIGKLPKVGLGLIAGILFMVATVVWLYGVNLHQMS